MGELLNLTQPETVTNYLLKNIITSELKFVRVGTQTAFGSIDEVHMRIAIANHLPLITVEETDIGCNDSGKVLFQSKSNRIVLFESSSRLRIVNNDGTVVPYDSEDFSAWKKQLTICRQITCQMFIAAINILPSRPELFYTIMSNIERVEKFIP